MHNQLAEIAKGALVRAELPDFRVRSGEFRLGLRTYSKLHDLETGGEYALRVLQSCKETRSVSAIQYHESGKLPHWLEISFTSLVRLRHRDAAEPVELMWVVIPMRGSSRPGKIVYTASATKDGGTRFHAWDGWEEPPAAWLVDYIRSSRTVRVVRTNRALPRNLPPGTMGEQREALQQLLSFGGSVYVYGHRLSLHYRHKPGRVGALDWLKPFERLYRINLSGGNVDEVLNKWPRMEKINWFDITAGADGISAAALAKLTAIESLDGLKLIDTTVTDQHFDSLGELNSITNLNFERPAFGGVDLQRLAELDNVRMLLVGKTGLTAEQFGKIITHSPGARLVFYDLPIDDDMIKSFERGRMTYLDLSETGISGRQMGRLLKKFPELNALSLKGEGLFDRSGFRAISSKRSLNELRIGGKHMDCGILSKLSLLDLKQLHIPDTAVTPEGLGILKAIPNLEYLRFVTGKIDEVLVDVLTRFEGLTTIYLKGGNTKLEMLEPLMHVSGLEKLYVMGTRFTREQVRELTLMNATKDRSGTYSTTPGFYVHFDVGR